MILCKEIEALLERNDRWMSISEIAEAIGGASLACNRVRVWRAVKTLLSTGDVICAYANDYGSRGAVMVRPSITRVVQNVG